MTIQIYNMLLSIRFSKHRNLTIKDLQNQKKKIIKI